MKLFAIFCAANILFSSIYCSERPDAWRTRGGAISANSIVWNYTYGQHELGRDAHDQLLLGKQPADTQLYGVACAAMATAAIAILGTRFGNNNIAGANATRIAEVMHEILLAGAQAYDATPQDAHGYAEAGVVLDELIKINEQLNLQTDMPLTEEYTDQIRDLSHKRGYNTEDPLRTLVGLLQQNVVNNPAILASGVVISDGATSRSIVYLRGNEHANARFVLYDSHATFLPDNTQRHAEAQLKINAAIAKISDDDVMAQIAASEQLLPLAGSFLAIARTVDDLMHIARADGRWPVDAAEPTKLPLALQSPVFIDVFKPRPASEGTETTRPPSPRVTSSSAPVSRLPSPPKTRRLSPAEQARTAAETLIIALSHAQNARDFEEIGKQFQDTLNALPEAAQIELITRFGNTQHNREHALRAEAIQLERTKQEHERAERARASIRVSPKIIAKPAQLPLAVIQAERLASKAASMDKVAVERAIKDLTRFIDEGHLSKEHQEKIDAALATLYARLETLGS